MKTTIILITVVLLTPAALPVPIFYQSDSERLAQQVITALKKGSPEDYAALFPTLGEFQAMMDQNSFVYGEYLSAAKEEFAVRYENEIMPSVKTSITSILQEGNKKGIDWSQINFESAECNMPAKDFETVPFTIVFSVKGKEYRMTIDKAFIMHKIWKVSSEISLYSQR